MNKENQREISHDRWTADAAKQVLFLAVCLFSVGSVFAQDADPAEEGSGAGEEECEEAWTYVEFLKKNVK